MKSKALVNKIVQLEKFPGKGGWTFARLDGVKKDPHAHFGWIKVRGHIDDFEIRQYHLMPMGDGNLFLPVRAEIRKKIKKAAGDKVKVVLYRDEDDIYIPEELESCLADDPDAAGSFRALETDRKKELIKYIYSLKNGQSRAERIASLMNNGWKMKP